MAASPTYAFPMLVDLSTLLPGGGPDLMRLRLGFLALYHGGGNTRAVKRFINSEERRRAFLAAVTRLVVDRMEDYDTFVEIMEQPCLAGLWDVHIDPSADELERLYGIMTAGDPIDIVTVLEASPRFVSALCDEITENLLKGFIQAFGDPIDLQGLCHELNWLGVHAKEVYDLKKLPTFGGVPSDVGYSWDETHDLMQDFDGTWVLLERRI